MVKKNIIIQGSNVRYYQSEKMSNENTLIFLHGWGSQASHFNAVLKKCDNFIAIDLPGFGDSETPSRSWSLTDYVSFIEEFLKKLNIDRPIMAGHSFGGSIGIKYCLTNQCKKLILIDSAGIRRKSTKNYLYLIFVKILKQILLLPIVRNRRDKIRRWFYKKIGSEDYINAGELTETYKKIISEDLVLDMQKITTPTVLIWGAEDKDTPIENAKLMQETIRNSELHVIPNAGHYVFLDNQEEFNQVFLSQIK